MRHGCRLALAMWFTRNPAAAVELPPPLSAEQARALAPLPLWSVDRAVASAAACSLASNDPLHEALLSDAMSAGARGEPLSRVIAAEESVVPPSAWQARMLASAMASAADGLPPAPAKTFGAPYRAPSSVGASYRALSSMEGPRQHGEVQRAVAVSLAMLASNGDEAPEAVPVPASLAAPMVANTPAPEPRSSIDEPELIGDHFKALEPRSSANSHAESVCPQLMAMRAAVRSRLKVYELLMRRAAASAAAAPPVIGPTAPGESAAPHQTLGQQHISDGFDVFG